MFTIPMANHLYKSYTSRNSHGQTLPRHEKYCTVSICVLCEFTFLVLYFLNRAMNQNWLLSNSSAFGLETMC